MRFLYDLFFLVFGILYIPYLVFKRKGHGEFMQRFSFLPGEVTKLQKPVWIHAVSVGEASLAGEISSALKKHFPDIPVVVSTTTKTGNEIARKSFGKSVDGVFYFPLDLSFVVSRVVRLLDPRLYLMIETELWPNLLEELRLKKVPVVMANGRISDPSFANYRKIRFLMKRILGNVDRYCMQSAKDAARIKQLGASADKVSVTGNIKFDNVSGQKDLPGISKGDLGFEDGDEVLVAGSTHYPEEREIIRIFKQIKKERKGLKLVLAPRHVERADEVKGYITEAGIGYCRFSEMAGGHKKGPHGKDAVLVDTIGHLKDIYNIATLIFVGGSIAKKGGQNPIEGARLGKAVVFGPYMSNFREVAKVLIDGGGAARVKDTRQLGSILEELLEDEGKRELMAADAKKVIESNAGAIDKTLSEVERYLK